MTVDETKRRIGRRGAVLLILAVVDFGVGWSFIDPTEEAARAQNAVWREMIAPSFVWGCIWIAVGLFCLVAAFTAQDSIGFTAAVGLKLLWASLEFAGWIDGAISQGYRPGLIWLGYALLIFVVSGLREPRRDPLIPRGERRDG